MPGIHSTSARVRRADRLSGINRMMSSCRDLAAESSRRVLRLFTPLANRLQQLPDFLLPVLSVLTADGGSFKLSTHCFASPWRRMASVCPRRPVCTAGSSSLCSAKIQVKLNVFKPRNKSDFSHKNQNQTVKREQHKHPAGVLFFFFYHCRW